MKQSTSMIILTVIILAVALFGRYTDTKIHQSATTILEDRLKPGPLLSHRFDYYGTYIDNAFSTNIVNIDTLLSHKEDILESREITDKEWKSYLATYLVPEEDSVAKLVDKQMVEMDKKLDEIFDLAKVNKIEAQKLLEESKIKEELPLITDRINWLTDLQTRVGQAETEKMFSLIRTFDNFMIGALALAVMLAGSILYSAIRDRKEKQQPTKKTPTKKPVVKKKPVKKPIKKK
jgi:methyl-accepting chemotaxis protein